MTTNRLFGLIRKNHQPGHNMKNNRYICQKIAESGRDRRRQGGAVVGWKGMVYQKI